MSIDQSHVEHLYRTLVDYCADGIFLTQPDGTILRVNPAACHMLGMSEQEIISRGRSGVVVDSDALVAGLAQRRENGVASGELTFRRGDGTTFPAELTSTLVTDRTGAPYACTVFRDVTARKRAEAGLRDALAANEQLVAELRDSLEKVKTLSGFLPICMHCKKIRDDQGYWARIEEVHLRAHRCAVQPRPVSRMRGAVPRQRHRRNVAANFAVRGAPAANRATVIAFHTTSAQAPACERRQDAAVNGDSPYPLPLGDVPSARLDATRGPAIDRPPHPHVHGLVQVRGVLHVRVGVQVRPAHVERLRRRPGHPRLHVQPSRATSLSDSGLAGLSAAGCAVARPGLHGSCRSGQAVVSSAYKTTGPRPRAARPRRSRSAAVTADGADG